MAHDVKLSPEAEADLAGIFAYVRDHASASIAQAYVRRILEFIAGFDLFPERGNLRDDIRPGLRIVGFERRVSIAFVVDTQEVIVLRVLYAGRELDDA
jgi:toxin ParE1/3/4